MIILFITLSHVMKSEWNSKSEWDGWSCLSRWLDEEVSRTGEKSLCALGLSPGRTWRWDYQCDQHLPACRSPDERKMGRNWALWEPLSWESVSVTVTTVCWRQTPASLAFDLWMWTQYQQLSRDFPSFPHWVMRLLGHPASWTGNLVPFLPKMHIAIVGLFRPS